MNGDARKGKRKRGKNIEVYSQKLDWIEDDEHKEQQAFCGDRI